MAILWKAGHDTVTDWDSPGHPKVAAPTYAGAVLGTHGKDVRIMSDVWAWVTYASVWDGDKVIDVAVGSGDHGGPYADVVVDATLDVLDVSAKWYADRAAAAAKAAREAAIDREIADAKRVAKGKDVTVVKGRKVPKGTTGRVFWFGATKFGMRVGLELADGSRVFTAASNVEVSHPDDHLDIDELIARRAA